MMETATPISLVEIHRAEVSLTNDLLGHHHRKFAPATMTNQAVLRFGAPSGRGGHDVYL